MATMTPASTPVEPSTPPGQSSPVEGPSTVIRSSPSVGASVDFVLGIDTSAYTTSVAMLTVRGEFMVEARRVLTVPVGRRGLRQSEAVFQHINNLPALLEAAAETRTGGSDRLVAVSASVSPRSRPDSYMPVFRVGESVARSLAASHGVPFVPVSHQDGHIWAGLWSAEPPVSWTEIDDAIVMHASGGTTELFRATRRPAGDSARWHVRLLSATEDLYAGQFIDRTGVRLGLPFPAGPHLERLAAEGDPMVAPLPVAVRGDRLSFSGPDTAAVRLSERGVPSADIAAAVEQCVADSLSRWASNVCEAELRAASPSRGADARQTVGDDAGDAREHPGSPRPLRFLGVGGVMANQRLRLTLAGKLSAMGIECVFASPRYSVDNAVGVAVAAFVHVSTT